MAIGDGLNQRQVTFLKVYRDRKLIGPACEQLNIDLDEFDKWVEKDLVFKKNLDKMDRLISDDLEEIMLARGGVFGREKYMKYKFGSSLDIFNALKYRNPRKYDKTAKSKAFARPVDTEGSVVVNIPGAKKDIPTVPEADSSSQ